jgi:adenosylmethionine-8-amino-7-oxononanoate aminotransferase
MSTAMSPKYQMCVYPGTGTNDGIKGDHIIIAPPYNISEKELRFMVKRIAVAVKDFFAQSEFKILEV